MARIFVTGSADGLGRATAATLLANGHEIVVHARSASRRSALQDLADRGAHTVVGDLGDGGQVRELAEQINAIGPMHAVIHNAGVYTGPEIAAVNILAPYLLTALIDRPRRLVYLTSGMHQGGRARVPDLGARASVSYSDSKLFVTALALAVARLWPDVCSNAVDPGWVPTRMGGPNAPDDLREGHRTQEWLAAGDDPLALTSGGYWFHKARREPHPAASDPSFQEALLDELAAVTGVFLPADRL